MDTGELFLQVQHIAADRIVAAERRRVETKRAYDEALFELESARNWERQTLMKFIESQTVLK